MLFHLSRPTPALLEPSALLSELCGSMEGHQLSIKGHQLSMSTCTVTSAEPGELLKGFKVSKHHKTWGFGACIGSLPIDLDDRPIT